MKPLYIKAKNLYSYDDLFIDLTNFSDQATLIRGKVLGKKSNNGAGKSAIINGIYYSLFGKDLKGKSLDSITRWKTKEGHAVEFAFEKDNIHYVFKRFYKFKSKNTDFTMFKQLEENKIEPVEMRGSGCELIIDGVPFFMKGDTPKIKQKMESVLGFSPSVFLNSVLVAQKDNKDGRKSNSEFLTQTDTEQKKILTDILDMIDIDYAHKVTKEELSSVEEAITHLEMKKSNYSKQLQEKEESISDIKEKEKNQSENVKNKIKSYDSEKEKLAIQIKELEKEVSEFKVPSIDKISETKKQLDLIVEKLNKDLQIETKLNQSLADIKSLITRSKDSIEESKKLISQKNQNIKESEEKLSSENKIEINVKDLNDKLSKLKEIEEKINIFSKKEKEEILLVNKKESLEKDLSKNKEVLKEKETELDLIKKESKCNECERPFNEGESEYFDKIFNKKESEIKSFKESITSKEELLSKSINDLNLIIKEKEELKNQSSDYSKIKSEIEDLKLKKEKATSHNKWIDSLENNLKRLKSDVENLEESIKEKEDSIRVNQEKIPKLEELSKEIVSKKEKRSQVQEKLNEVNVEYNSVESKNKELKNLKYELKLKQERLDLISEETISLLNQDNPYEEILIKEDKYISKLKDYINEANVELEKKYKRKKILTFWQIGFSQVGLKSYIIEEVLDLLNIKSQEYLSEISEGTLSILFEAEKNDKNKTNIIFYNEDNKASFDDLSGGEQKACIRSVDLALSDISKSRFKISLDMKFLDEPFDGMDEHAKEIAFALFNKMAKGSCGYFIVSHDEKIQSFFSNSIYVLKENGVSRIVSEEEFNKH